MYEHQNIDAWLSPPAAASALTAANPVASINPIRPGYQPLMPVAIYALVTVQPTVTAPVIEFKFRPLIGSAVGEVVIGTLTIPLATIAGQMVYKMVDNTKCLQGGEIVASVTTGATAGNAHLGVLSAPSWEHPGNNAKMVRSV